jgi:hypothetical protein
VNEIFESWTLKTPCYLTTVALVLAAFNLSAQSAAELNIQTYAGLTITGEIGKVYAVEYVTDLAQTNDPTAWRCLEYLQLPTSRYLWADKSAAATGKWTSTRFSYGDDPGYTNLTDYAWYRNNSDGQTHPVGQKLPNPWGLYDMHGNVWEMCQDWWAGNHPGGWVVDPQGPAAGLSRTRRGGSWHFWNTIGNVDRWLGRSAVRCGGLLDSSYDCVGFRAVLAPGQ